MKTCTKCGATKPESEYYKRGKGLRADCKKCFAAGKRAYRERNREQIAANQRAYRERNREQIAAYQRAYYERNREQLAAQKRAYREQNREQIAAQNRAYYEQNREQLAAQKRAYYEQNREQIAANQRAYYEQNRDITSTLAQRTREPWQDWEDAYITNHPEFTTFQLAVDLSRTTEAVKTRRRHLRNQGVLA